MEVLEKKLTWVTYEWHPRRAKNILEAIRTIDPNATSSGANGYGIILTELSPSQCEEVLSKYLESGVIRSIK